MQAGVITVQMLGGNAEVEVLSDFAGLLRAPAQIVCSGSVRAEVFASW